MAFHSSWCVISMLNSSVNSHELHKFHEFVFIREIRGVIFIHLLVRRRRMLSPL